MCEILLKITDVSTRQLMQITKDGVKAAVRQTKGGKASGGGGGVENDIRNVEVRKSLESFGIEKLTQLFKSIFDTGQFPDDLVESIFIPHPRKPVETTG